MKRTSAPQVNQHKVPAEAAAKSAKGSKADATTSRSVALARAGKIGRMFKAKTFRTSEGDMDLGGDGGSEYGDSPW